MFDLLEIVSPEGEVHFVDLDPAVGILNIGRHPDNGIVLNGPHIRSFHALLDYRQTPYQVLFLDEDGANGPGQEFDQWQTLRIGDYELVLVSNGDRQTPAGPSPAEHSQAAPVPQASHTGGQLPVPAIGGEHTAAQTLTIHNSGRQAATFFVDVQGINPRWVEISPQQVSLDRDERAEITIGLVHDVAPGYYPFTWQISSPQHPGWQQSQGISLISATPPAAITWGKLQPAEIRSKPFRRSGMGFLPLLNPGSQPVAYHLWARDLRGGCRIRFALPDKGPGGATVVSQGDSMVLLHLPPGETRVQVTLQPESGGFWGVRSERHRFVIHGDVGTNNASASATGTFDQRPAINIGWLFLVMAIISLAGIVLYRDQVGRWMDGWRYPLFSTVVSGTPTPFPQLINGFTAEELARYRRSAPPATGGEAQGTTSANLSYQEIFTQAGRQYNLDWRLLAALSYRESRLDPEAVGGSGEYGLMQIMPGTWNEWAPLVDVDDPWDPYSNILVGTAYLSYIHGYFSSLGHIDPKWALAAYNWGPERVLQILDRRGGWQEIPLPQRQYVADILLGVDQAQGRVRAADAVQMSLVETEQTAR